MHDLITAVEDRFLSPAGMADAMIFVTGVAAGALLVLGALASVA